MKHEFPNLSAVNTAFPEGRMLIAALSQLTLEGENIHKEPDTVLREVAVIADKIYSNVPDDFEPLQEPQTLVGKITKAINQHSRENESNTPDFILAEYLLNCLAAFESASNAREKWYGKSLTINNQ